MKTICKLIVTLSIFTLSSCIQINLGSSVVNVSSPKVLHDSEGATVTGSELKENLLDQDAEAEIPLK
jgi:hypothetical protein